VVSSGILRRILEWSVEALRGELWGLQYWVFQLFVDELHVSLRISGVCVQHWEGKFFSGWRFRVKCVTWWGSAVVLSSASL
jgi:hypothetical protein